MKKFNKADLLAANKEAEDLLLVAQFSPSERNRFLNKIRKALSRDSVSLDFIENLL